MTEILHKCAEQSNSLCYIFRHQLKSAKRMQLFPGVREASLGHVAFNPVKHFHFDGFDGRWGFFFFNKIQK